MRDFGYDVADYRDIDPVFGSLADMDALIAGAHARGIRVLLDFVPNHTSSDHPWFVDARSSRDAEHRDWYVWRDPAPGGGPPNDLVSQFGGPAWTLDEATGQYWYHSFLPEQPELDWRNPAVRDAMLDHLRFWFERGIDGFRIDVLWMIAKDDAPWRDGPITERRRSGARRRPARRARARRRAGHGGAARRAARRRRRVPGPGADRRGLHAARPGSCGTTAATAAARTCRSTSRSITLPWDAGCRRAPPWPRTRRRSRRARGPTGCWATTTSRGSRRGVGAAQARVAAMLLLTLRGTPTLYYGDELGLPDVPVPPDARSWTSRRPRPRALADAVGPRRRRTPASRPASRGCRWSTTPAACSVEAQRDDPRSMLALHRRLLALRRAEPALHAGSWAAAPGAPGGRRVRPGRRRAPGSGSCST